MNANAFGNFLGPDTLIIFLIILLFFGARRLPNITQNLDEPWREFREEHPSTIKWFSNIFLFVLTLLVILYVLSL